MIRVLTAFLVALPLGAFLAQDEASEPPPTWEAHALDALVAGAEESGERWVQLLDGRSPTMAVPDIGTTLVLYLEGEEVGRMPIRLNPGEVTNVTF